MAASSRRGPSTKSCSNTPPAEPDAAVSSFCDHYGNPLVSIVNRRHPALSAWEDMAAELRRQGVDGWLIVCPYHLGDTYLICSLLKAFAESRSDGRKIYLLTEPKQAEIPRLFAPWATPVAIPGLGPEMANLLTPMSSFEPNRPFIVHMLHYGDGRLGAFMGHRSVTVMDVWRYILQLPFDAPIMSPVVWPELQERAEAAFNATGLPRGRTAVFFPKAYTTPPMPDRYWIALAEELARRGWAAATSVVGDEQPFPGTVPVRFPIVDTLPFVELAGWAISSRSGICDVFAQARCRKTVVYTRRIGMRAFGLAAMGLAFDAEEHLLENDPPVEQVVAALTRSPVALG